MGTTGWRAAPTRQPRPSTNVRLTCASCPTVWMSQCTPNLLRPCVLNVDDSKKLGEWAGLCKIDKEGKARKVNGCGVVVVKDYGKETQALDVLNDYFKSKK